MLYLKISQNLSAVMIKKLKIKLLIGLRVLSYPVGPTQSPCVSTLHAWRQSVLPEQLLLSWPRASDGGLMSHSLSSPLKPGRVPLQTHTLTLRCSRSAVGVDATNWPCTLILLCPLKTNRWAAIKAGEERSVCEVYLVTLFMSNV